MMRQTAPGALIQRGDPEEDGRIKSELSDYIAEAGDQRVGDEPANGLRAVQTGVIVFAKSGAAKGNDGRSRDVQKHRRDSRLFSFAPLFQKRSSIPNPSAKAQAHQQINRADIDRSEKMINLQHGGDDPNSAPQRVQR